MKNLNIFSLVEEYDNAKSGGVLNVPNVSFVDEDSSVRYLIDPYNGYEYVDLGLPSGLKWATCNVGASSPEQTGLYFAWGETTGYTANDVTFGVRAFNEDVYNAGPAASISADLTLEQDAAHVNLGGNWRMPTREEFNELKNNTTKTWTTDYNGTKVKGYIVTSKTNGKSIFLPGAGDADYSEVYNVGDFGFYWSASWQSSSSAYRLFFNFQSNQVDFSTHKYTRRYGYPVRGVCE